MFRVSGFSRQRGVEDALVIERERFDRGGTGPEMSWDGLGSRERDSGVAMGEGKDRV